MRLYKVKIAIPGYWSDADKKEKHEADKARLESVFYALTTRPVDLSDEIYLITEVDLPAILESFHLGEDYRQINIVSIRLAIDLSDPAKTLQPMIERLELAASRLTAKHDGFNQHTQSPIAGPHLLSVNDTLLCEDCCTNELQARLDEGWRIIAVCPQEARRPDYILGRYVIGKGA
jgi:hypothetical protein